MDRLSHRAERRRWSHVPGAGGILAALLCTAPLADKPSGLLDQVNDVRARHHLLQLEEQPALAEVALAHARDMAEHGYLDHVDRNGHNPMDRVRAAGIDGFRLLAENIAASSGSGNRIPTIIENWLASPVHRENLLNPAFNRAGTALVRSEGGRTLVVQIYATF